MLGDRRGINTAHVRHHEPFGLHFGDFHAVLDAGAQRRDPAHTLCSTDDLRAADLGIEADDRIRIGSRGNGRRGIGGDNDLRTAAPH